MFELIKGTTESLKEDKILILFTFLPFIIMFILIYALKMELPAKGLTFPTTFVLPFLGTETFLSNIEMNRWTRLIDYKEWKDFGMQIFFFGSMIYYFIIYSFYSKSKLGGKLAILQCLLLALLFVFLSSYLFKFKIVIISSLAILFVFVIPAGSSGLGFFESFQESFRIVKENFLEVFLLFLLSVGIFIVVGLFSQEFILTLLDLFKFSLEQEAIASYIFVTFVASVIIAFQIILFTNYFLTKKKTMKIE
jgi:hypothetical protein